jgi:hypothetical protein
MRDSILQMRAEVAVKSSVRGDNARARLMLGRAHVKRRPGVREV